MMYYIFVWISVISLLYSRIYFVLEEEMVVFICFIWMLFMIRSLDLKSYIFSTHKDDKNKKKRELFYLVEALQSSNELLENDLYIKNFFLYNVGSFNLFLKRIIITKKIRLLLGYDYLNFKLRK